MDRKLIGELTPEENKMNTEFRRNMNDAKYQLGSLALQGMRVAFSVFESEHKVEGMFRKVAERLDIPKDVQWETLPDGRVFVLSSPEAEKADDEEPSS